MLSWVRAKTQWAGAGAVALPWRPCLQSAQIVPDCAIDSPDAGKLDDSLMHQRLADGSECLPVNHFVRERCFHRRLRAGSLETGYLPADLTRTCGCFAPSAARVGPKATLLATAALPAL